MNAPVIGEALSRPDDQGIPFEGFREAGRMASIVSARWIAVFAVVLGVAAAGPALAGEGTVRGVVSAGGAGQAGVSVEVYLEEKKSMGGTPFAVTESGEGGRFEIGLPAGRYYFWAKGKAPAFGPPLVSEYAGNPVTVADGRATELTSFVLREAGRDALPAAPKQTGLRGRVVAGGSPAAEASVMVYAAGAAKLAGPGFLASLVTDADGAFQFDLPPGAYRVVARRRQGGGAAGFLQQGDLSAEYAGNPVAVVAGKYASIGDLALHPVDAAKLSGREKERRAGSAPTVLAGTVVGPDGNPLAGQHVFMYRDQGMIGRPEMMAETAKDGSFVLDVPGAGTWYLGARSTMGGPRQPGEMAGRLQGSPDSSVAVRAGERRGGLVIRMEVVW